MTKSTKILFLTELAICYFTIFGVLVGVIMYLILGFFYAGFAALSTPMGLGDMLLMLRMALFFIAVIAAGCLGFASIFYMVRALITNVVVSGRRNKFILWSFVAGNIGLVLGVIYLIKLLFGNVGLGSIDMSVPILPLMSLFTPYLLMPLFANAHVMILYRRLTRRSKSSAALS